MSRRGGLRGSFALMQNSGIQPVTVTVPNQIFYFRWRPAQGAGPTAIVKRITVGATALTAFAAGHTPLALAVVKATAWTGQGTLGTNLNPTGSSWKLDNSGNSTLIVSGDVRIANTDANGLGVGTKTDDPLGCGGAMGLCPAVAPFEMLPPGTVLFDGTRQPIVLSYEQGIVVLVSAIQAGTGTWRFQLGMEWDETNG